MPYTHLEAHLDLEDKRLLEREARRQKVTVRHLVERIIRLHVKTIRFLGADEFDKTDKSTYVS